VSILFFIVFHNRKLLTILIRTKHNIGKKKEKGNFWIVEYQNDIKNNETIVVFRNIFKKKKDSLFFILLHQSW